MRRFLQSGLIAVAALALVAPAAPALASSGGGGAGLAPVGSAAAVPSTATALGALPDDQTISFDVVLKPRNQAALDQFVQDVSTPGSAHYHQFLQTGEYAQRFGPTPQAIAAVTAQMKQLGLTVNSVQGAVVQLSASTSKVTSALHTSFKQYRLKSGRIARANVIAPKLSTSVSPYVQGIVGLDTVTRASHPTPAVKSALGNAGIAHTNVSAPTVCFTEQSSGYYSANQLASYYGLDSYWNAGNFGAGTTIAMFELEPYDSRDIAYYKSCTTTNVSVTNVSVDGGAVADPSATNPGIEATLDIEGAIGLAPAAAIRVYGAPNSGQGIVDNYAAIANQNVAQVVSTSWGICEALIDQGFANSERQIFEQMAAQGQTVFAAAGDHGSADCDYDPPNTTADLAVDDPASQPEVTGVGGTDLTSETGPETPWNNGLDSSIPVGGGGGISEYWQMPAWQQALGVVGDSSGVPCGAGVGAYCREVPDVSASADPHDGYVIAYDVVDNPTTPLTVVGGTSAAAPLWASFIALLDSSCPGNRVGLVNPALYAIDAQNSGAFNDLATGDNDAAGVNGGAYPAGSGYDMATGLGTPVAATIGAALCATPATAGSGTLTVDHTTAQVSTPTTLTFTYTLPGGFGMADGELDITVPSGWPTPSTTGTGAGFTTSSLGQVTIAGSKITVTGITATAGASFTVTYGDTSAGGPGATSPATPRASTFTSSVAASHGVTVEALAASPTVTVWAAATAGQGTMSVSPTAAITNTPTALTFTYAPPANTKLIGGTVTVDVPGSWTPPQTTNASAAAYVTASTGTPSTSGTKITVTGVNLDLGQTLSISYGAGAGGGGLDAASETSNFAATQGGTALATSPTVTTNGVANDGTGTLTASPATVAPGAHVTIAFTYKAPSDGFISGGELKIGVPADWPAPSTTNADPGQVTAPGAVISAAGQTIDVKSINLSPAASLVITYGTKSFGGPGALVPAADTSAAFPAQQRSTTGGTLTALLPDVTIAIQASSGGGGGGGGGAFGHPDLTRVAGADRIATSIAASQAAFPKANSARAAVLARADSFADALPGTPLAATEGGPLLLTNTTALPAATVDELNRVLPLGDTIYLLGGTSAISANVQTQLTSMGYSVTRLAGADRFATAVAVAGALNNPTTVFEADGTNFPDALSAGSAAAQQGAAVLLTSGGAQSAATAGYLSAHPSVRYAVGGPAAKADPGATPLVGADRFATSVLVATKFFNAPLSVGLASGMNFPDALSGGAVTANHGGPILLVPSSGTVPAGSTSYLTKTAAVSASSAWLFGGTASVNDSVFSQSAAALKAS